MRKAEKFLFFCCFCTLGYGNEMNCIAYDRGQGHFRAVSPCTNVMVIYINFVVNNLSATSLVQVSGEHLQEQ